MVQIVQIVSKAAKCSRRWWRKCLAKNTHCSSIKRKLYLLLLFCKILLLLFDIRFQPFFSILVGPSTCLEGDKTRCFFEGREGSTCPEVAVRTLGETSGCSDLTQRSYLCSHFFFLFTKKELSSGVLFTNTDNDSQQSEIYNACLPFRRNHNALETCFLEGVNKIPLFFIHSLKARLWFSIISYLPPFFTAVSTPLIFIFPTSQPCLISPYQLPLALPTLPSPLLTPLHPTSPSIPPSWLLSSPGPT